LGPVDAENEDLGKGRVNWRDGGKIGGGIEGGRKRNQDQKKKSVAKDERGISIGGMAAKLGEESSENIDLYEFELNMCVVLSGFKE